MFTGLIQDIGTILARTDKPNGCRLRIATSLPSSDLSIGASVACSGACMTVVAHEPGWFDVEVSDESLRCTHMDTWQKETKVNLEPSLRLGDELGGHLVTGHVDGLGTVHNITQLDDNWQLDIAFPDDLAPMIAAKGSVTVDGTSLTVNMVNDHVLSINLIPHTWQHTVAHTYKKGTQVHLEIDLIARYLYRMAEFKA